jgi:hypothetical protein
MVAVAESQPSGWGGGCAASPGKIRPSLEKIRPPTGPE